jgi:uncharacterized repeat protein (TIGR01451 family)
MADKHPKKLILEALIDHPEGLTMVSLAENVGLHRHTTTKYVYELLGAGLVYQRKVGSARLCYLKVKPKNLEKIKPSKTKEKKIPGRKSQIKFIAIFSLLGIILASSVVIASNLLNQTLNGSYTGEFISNLTLDNETLENVTQTIPNVEIVTNESTDINFSEPSPVFNGTADTDETNASEIVNETQPIEIPPIETSKLILNVHIESPKKITRDETITITANIENSGSSVARNVSVNWVLPRGFDIVLEEGNCENLEPNTSCTSMIVVKTSLSSELGLDEIKVVVSYGE